MLDPLKSQQEAANPNVSVWVMASAGSGKTKVLTDRILRLLLDGVEPHKILCLTYTKVASVEMQKRLYHELQKWVVCDDENLTKIIFNLTGKNPHKSILLLARSLLATIIDNQFKIKIQTIHSFCMSILQNFPFEAKIPINFELIDENRNKILLKNCQNNILNSIADDRDIKNNSDNFLLNILQKINSQTSEATLNDLVSQLLNKKDRLYRLKNQYHDIANFTQYLFKKFKIDQTDLENITEKIFEKFIENLNLRLLKNFVDTASDISKSDNKNCQSINIFLNQPNIENFSSLMLGFFTKENTPRKFTKKTLEIFANQIDNFQHLIDNFNQQIQAIKTIENSINLIIIVDKILEDFHFSKISNGYLDYGDLINMTNQLLCDPKNCEWIKLKMDYTFDHLLVDEAQDTSPVQWSIIKSLVDDFFSGETRSTKHRSIFIVGDEKQSIMGFQGANINQTKEFYDFLCQKSDYKLKNIELSVSFRSGKKILQLVDAIFEQKNLQNAICKISKYSPHISHRNTVGYAELWAFENPEIIQEDAKKSQIFDDFFAKKNHFDDKDNLAKFVAHKIKNWIAEKRIIFDKNRQIEYGDIMILVRNRQNGLIDKLANNFSQLKIPFISVGKIKFSENLLIQDFLSIARFALLPIDCYNLACLLKSPFFNLSDQDLLVFCKEKNQQNLKLWNILQTTEFNENLQNIINISKNVNCFEFYYYILNDLINQKNIVARFGSVALEIINNFLFICQDFYLNDSPNLQNFIEFIDKIDPEINLSSNQHNRVKITTVHSSKGLQAPIVILPDCLYSYSKQSDNKEKIIWDNDFPLWINSDSKINNCIKELYDNKILQNYEEHLRLLYVALTRAEDEIYIGGLSKTFDDKCWYNLINNLSDNFIKKVNYSLQLISSPENNVSNNYNFDLTNFNYINDNNLQKFQLINQSLSFGEYLHKALEIIGKNHFMPKDFLLNYLNKYFSNHLKIDNIILVKIIDICKKFIDSTIFNEIFKDNSPNKIFCEYEINNEDLNLRIDLLKISDSKILIIDYKSDDNPPDKAPQQYLTQLDNYKIAVQKIYPYHQITAKILWIKLLKFNQEI